MVQHEVTVRQAGGYATKSLQNSTDKTKKVQTSIDSKLCVYPFNERYRFLVPEQSYPACKEVCPKTCIKTLCQKRTFSDTSRRSIMII